MQHTPINGILAGRVEEGESVTVRGWIYRTRSSGGVAFVVVRDPSGVIQCAVKKGASKGFEDSVKALIESSVRVTGTVKKDSRAPGGYELQATDFRVTHFSETFPITKDQSTEFLLDVRHLWLRSQHLTNVLKARHFIVKYLRDFFDGEGFWEISPPIITKAGCEGGSTLFELDYFGEKAYLTQSGQLYNEAFITALENVFVLAPSFRAEKSRTIKHLTEYWHLEEEAAYFDNDDNMRLQEEMVSYVAQEFAKKNADLLVHFKRKPEELLVVEPPFERMTYEDAVKKCGLKYGDDFGAPDETSLTEGMDKPVFVKNFPKEMKPFYMAVAADNKHALCADLFAPEGHGEIIGGSQREWEYDKLVSRMKKDGLDLKDYEWYLDLRRYGSVPHSGFGLGIERLVKWMLNLEHIRDAIAFPRVINRAYP
ncbi:asparagine--tRNA ligase [Candidatus Micrarchaeota archaeon CG10_big_fil_rev_8_21_14_0_10_59_7]|nr:MAG: asparagine--tRNA ligase [Candidatus Micrarchaeota archaeon CG10_big_fil_rev_8_21_14_0_10_59_7]